EPPTSIVREISPPPTWALPPASSLVHFIWPLTSTRPPTSIPSTFASPSTRNDPPTSTLVALIEPPTSKVPPTSKSWAVADFPTNSRASTSTELASSDPLIRSSPCSTSTSPDDFRSPDISTLPCSTFSLEHLRLPSTSPS